MKGCTDIMASCIAASADQTFPIIFEEFWMILQSRLGFFVCHHTASHSSPSLSSRRKWRADKSTFFTLPPCQAARGKEARAKGYLQIDSISPSDKYLLKIRFFFFFPPPHCKPVIGPISVCAHFDILVAFPFNLNPPKWAHNAPAMFFPPVVSLSTFYLSRFHHSADVKKKIPRPDFPSSIN